LARRAAEMAGPEVLVLNHSAAAGSTAQVLVRGARRAAFARCPRQAPGAAAVVVGQAARGIARIAERMEGRSAAARGAAIAEIQLELVSRRLSGGPSAAAAVRAARVRVARTT